MDGSDIILSHKISEIREKVWPETLKTEHCKKKFCPENQFAKNQNLINRIQTSDRTTRKAVRHGSAQKEQNEWHYESEVLEVG